MLINKTIWSKWQEMITVTYWIMHNVIPGGKGRIHSDLKGTKTIKTIL